MSSLIISCTNALSQRASQFTVQRNTHKQQSERICFIEKMQELNGATFLEHGRLLFRKKSRVSRAIKTDKLRFRQMFGTDPHICAIMWNKIHPWQTISADARPQHLLWALLFLNQYATEAFNCAITGCSEKTFKKWSTLFIDKVSSLKNETIVWENRFRNHRGTHCVITVDGTDCPILEQSPFWPGWFSHKFKGPGVRYEIGVSIHGGEIVWVNGPFPCGKWPDVKNFRHGLIHRLLYWEMVEADRGYGGMPDHVYTPLDDRSEHVRARHESLNSRFKKWNILSNAFRHDLGPNLSNH
jgi:hypothetical protein